MAFITVPFSLSSYSLPYTSIILRLSVKLNYFSLSYSSLSHVCFNLTGEEIYKFVLCSFTFCLLNSENR